MGAGWYLFSVALQTVNMISVFTVCISGATIHKMYRLVRNYDTKKIIHAFFIFLKLQICLNSNA